MLLIQKNQFFNILDRVGLANKSHIKVANLSIGEKQRLAVARAFVGDPKWVFCDELNLIIRQ